MSRTRGMALRVSLEVKDSGVREYRVLSSTVCKPYSHDSRLLPLILKESHMHPIRRLQDNIRPHTRELLIPILNPTKPLQNSDDRVRHLRERELLANASASHMSVKTPVSPILVSPTF